ncbi:MAG TPA: hypothetical protein VK973_00595 [Arenicellales bacterium]|nr:hypothetical protein [Arenicellales bacterium]
MSFAVQPSLPIPSDRRLDDLPRQAQFLILALRLAHELPIHDRNFQGFIYTLCGISRVEKALGAIQDVLHCLSRASRRLRIEATVSDTIAEDERRLLELLRCRWDFGLAIAGGLVPRPLDETLIRALNRLADTLE